MNKESKQTVCSNIPLTEWKGTVTLFKGMTSTTPTNEIKEVAWEDIQSAICTEHATTSLKKNEGLYFIPCLLKEAPLVGNTFKTAEATGQPTIGKMRSKNHVTEASMLVMDIDGRVINKSGVQPDLKKGGALC